MNAKTLQVLEFDKILHHIKKYAQSSVSYPNIDAIAPFALKSESENALQLLAEAHNVYYKYNLRPLTEFPDALPIAEKAKAGAILTFGELLKAAALLRSGRIAKNAIFACPESFNLQLLTGKYFDQEKLEKEIYSKILSEDEISDSASPELHSIRRRLAAENLKLRDKLSTMARTGEYAKYLQDNIVTMRQGRYVLPVKAECRSSVPGLMHDRSSTGATVFIEPYAVVEMNNEIRTLQIDEAAEIEKILSDLSFKVAEAYGTICAMQQALVELDVIFSKLLFCTEYYAVPPIFGSRIKLMRARHPLIDKRKVVPVDIVTEQNKKLVIITGPNTGGKTVSLKTVGLFALMAASGLWIPAEEGSEIPFFTSVCPDIGDEQSIESSLSTFSSHITNIAQILNGVTAGSLVLLDELGAGTDPAEGAALAIGILKFLQGAGCHGIITTHYGELKEYALSSGDMLIASMQFDAKSLRPTYRLIPGLPGSSNALKIASTLGMNPTVLQAAYESLSQEKKTFEGLLSVAEDMKNQSITELAKINEEREQIEKLRVALESERTRLAAEREKISASARAEVRRIVSGSVEYADALIDELRLKIKEENERALLDAKKIRNKIEDYKYGFSKEEDDYTFEDLPQELIREDERVVIKNINAEGIILSVNHKKQTAKVRAGAAVADIPFDNLAKPLVVQKQQKRIAQKSVQKAIEGEGGGNLTSEDKEYALREVDLRGKTVSESVEELEGIIFEMHSLSLGKGLRIIHGKGTGALARGVQSYLKSEPKIKSFRYGKYGEGDTGVTIAEIK